VVKLNAQVPQLYSLEELQILKDNWNHAFFNNFSLPGFENYGQAHRQVVYTIQLLGDYLISAGRDKTIRIWNTKRGTMVRGHLTDHTTSILCLKFEKNGKEDVIISAGADASFIIWEFSTGKLRERVNHAHESSILNLCFDENHLVTSSKESSSKSGTAKGNFSDMQPKHPMRARAGMIPHTSL
jgi:F-box and WD-40 domain protein 1/11